VQWARPGIYHESKEVKMSDNQRPEADQEMPPQSSRGSNIGLIVVLFLILGLGIASGFWWILRGGQDTADPAVTTPAELPRPTEPAPVQETSTSSAMATIPTQGSSTPVPTRVGSKQAVPAMPRKFGDFETRNAADGNDSLVTYWTAKKDRFFIIGYMQGGSVETQTKDLREVRTIGKTVCGTNDFKGYECFAQVHGGVGRTTMGPGGTLEELAEISRTFYETWR